MVTPGGISERTLYRKLHELRDDADSAASHRTPERK
jgi:hypothetical protein